MILVVFLICTDSVSARENSSCSKSTEGTDFWFGFMESRNYIMSHNVKIIVTARETTTFTITVGRHENSFNGIYTVFADSSIQISIPWQLVETTGSERVQDKGIHLVSQKPVNVYALNWDPYSSDVAVIYPVETLGTEYFALCYYPNIDPRNPESGSGRNSEFLIVAVEDQTKVEITPSKVTDNLIPKDSTVFIYLNKGEVYQVQSENKEGTDKSGQGDLTGSHVIADKPVAFYSGALSTTVPDGSCCWDHLYEQIPPIHSWGREYFTVPLKTREKDIYRILAAEDNTSVQISGEPIFYLNRGEFREFELYQDNAKQILSDKPILAAQFSLSHDADSTITGGNGDPFMLILNSTDQWINEVTFVSFQSPNIETDSTYVGIKRHFVNIVTLSENVPDILLDGESIQSEFKLLPELNYSFAQIETGPGNHHLENIGSSTGFLAYVYGFGKWESYGYGSGFNVNLVLDLGENIEFFKGDTLLLCYGDTLNLDAGSHFDTFHWSTGAESQTISVIDSGLIWVEAATNDGCVLRDTVFVFKSYPETDIGDRFDAGCQPYSVILNGGSGFEKYIWQNEFNDTLSINSFYVASETGEYRLTVYNNYRCTAHDTIGLTVFPVPEIEIRGEHLICGTDTTKLSVSITGTPDSIWNYAESFEWKINSPEVIFSEESQYSVKIKAMNWGDYEIYYWLKTIDDCEKVDTFKIRFHPEPVSDFRIEDDPGCSGYSKILAFTGVATSAADFDWNLNGRIFLDTLDQQNRIYLISEGALQTNVPPVSLVIKDKGCLSDTVVKSFVNASPNFTMQADKTRGCDSLTVNFTSEMLTSDNVEFYWTFNDTEFIRRQNITKNYQDTGFFKVTLTITNPVTRCRNSFTIDSMIKVFPTPTAEISADPSFCYPDSALLVYTHHSDSSFCIWEFNDNQFSGFEYDSVTMILENPFENVKLTVNEYGCISEPVEIQLKRKPDFDFVIESQEGCQPFSAEVFAESPDDFLNYYWVTDSVPFSGVSNIYFFPDTGRFDVTLIAASGETGCIDTLMKPDWIWVHQKPHSKFEVDYPVALIDNADIRFINYSERAENYFWDFGDSLTSKEFEPVHLYSKIGDFKAQLFAESAFGCLDTFLLDIKIIPSTVYSPNAFRPDSDIPENRTFMPVVAGADENRFNLTIFSRWGDVVFESESPFYPWDGKLKNSEDAPMGNYVWISNYFDIQGFEHNEKGQVLLIR